MSANKLKLNPDKTEFIVFGNKRQQAKLAPFFPADILGNGLVPAVTVKNLGVKLYSSPGKCRKGVSAIFEDFELLVPRYL